MRKLASRHLPRAFGVRCRWSHTRSWNVGGVRGRGISRALRGNIGHNTAAPGTAISAGVSIGGRPGGMSPLTDRLSDTSRQV